MFEHSVKVPRHYKIASKIFKTVLTEGGSVKTLLYDDKLRHFRTNVLYALITETVKHSGDIDNIFEHCNLIKNEPRFDPWLAKVLTAELLFGKKSLPGKSKPEQTILSYKEQFEKYVSEHQDALKTEDSLTPNNQTFTMDNTEERPMLPDQTKRAIVVLAYLFLYSVAMFTLPFVAFFGVQHLLLDYYSYTKYAANAWAVCAAVLVVNTIIGLYAYKAYYEKEYDDDGNEIDQHTYKPSPPADSNRNSLNLKED